MRVLHVLELQDWVIRAKQLTIVKRFLGRPIGSVLDATLSEVRMLLGQSRVKDGDLNTFPGEAEVPEHVSLQCSGNLPRNSAQQPPRLVTSLRVPKRTALKTTRQMKHKTTARNDTTAKKTPKVSP